MRYVSHAEMLRVFQRACARVAIPLSHSRGFNPRPRLSLPLPRSVGVESDDELLWIRLDLATGPESQSCNPRDQFDADRLMKELGRQLPNGCDLTSVSVAESTTPPRPASVIYALTLPKDRADDKLEAAIEFILHSESLPVQRSAAGRKKRPRTVDVRRFIKSVEFTGEKIIVECSISPNGSIRVEEILNLLKLDAAVLAAPVKRTNVRWLKN